MTDYQPYPTATADPKQLAFPDPNQLTFMAEMEQMERTGLCRIVDVEGGTPER